MKDTTSLDLSPEEIRRCGHAAVEWMAKYLGALPPVYSKTSASEIRGKLDRALPSEGVAFDELLETFREVILPSSRHNAHSRMFGYVQSPGTALVHLPIFLHPP